MKTNYLRRTESNINGMRKATEDLRTVHVDQLNITPGDTAVMIAKEPCLLFGMLPTPAPSIYDCFFSQIWAPAIVTKLQYLNIFSY